MDLQQVAAGVFDFAAANAAGVFPVCLSLSELRTRSQVDWIILHTGNRSAVLGFARKASSGNNIKSAIRRGRHPGMPLLDRPALRGNKKALGKPGEVQAAIA